MKLLRFIAIFVVAGSCLPASADQATKSGGWFSGWSSKSEPEPAPEPAEESGGWFSGWSSSSEPEPAPEPAKESGGWFSGWSSSSEPEPAPEPAEESGGWFSGWSSSSEPEPAPEPAKESGGWFSGWSSSSEPEPAPEPAKENGGWFSGWFSSDTTQTDPSAESTDSAKYESQIDRNAFAKVKREYWKNHDKRGYSEENKRRMEQGNAPIGPDGNPIELHHVNGQPDGPLVEMSRKDHREGDNYKQNHPFVFDPQATPQKYQDFGKPSAANGAPRNQWVNGYTRQDGTQVKGYFRSAPQGR